MQKSDLYAEIQAADQRIRTLVHETPLDPLPGFSDIPGISVYAKLENLQPTGSFKLRGVTNKLCLLPDASRNVVTASTGNHGAATAYAVKHMNGKGLVFVPENASPSKIQTIQNYGADIRYIGKDSIETENAARQYASEHKRPYISPYNDRDVIAGQGTIGCELHRQQPKLDAVFIALGGGGLVSGIANYLKTVSPQTQIIACSPSNSNVMMASVKASKILDLASAPTFSDGTAGGVEKDAITFDYCSTLVDQFIEVSEYEIATAVKKFIDARRLLIEGAAGVAIAAFLKTQTLWKNKTIAIIICGGNISTKTLKQILIM